MGNYNFSEDLATANETEKEIAALMILKGATKVSRCQDNRFDISATVDGKPRTFEIKEDFLVLKTKNVSLEFESRGKPSGINTTQAEFYIYKLHTQDGVKYLITKTSKIKEAIAKRKYAHIVNGGDKDSNTMNYLFRYAYFIKLGKFIWEQKNLDTGEKSSILTE